MQLIISNQISQFQGNRLFWEKCFLTISLDPTTAYSWNEMKCRLIRGHTRPASPKRPQLAGKTQSNRTLSEHGKLYRMTWKGKNSIVQRKTNNRKIKIRTKVSWKNAWMIQLRNRSTFRSRAPCSTGSAPCWMSMIMECWHLLRSYTYRLRRSKSTWRL